MNANQLTITQGDCREVLKTLPDESVQCCVTSPPYWGLRDYGHADQIGLEETYEDYVANMVELFGEVRRVLKADGTLWLNLGDCYATGAGSARSPGGKCFGKQNEAVDSGAFPSSQPNRMPQPGLKPKDLCMIPARVALALQADGWYLRSDIIWHKPNPMPESVTDRPTKAHEYLFLLTKSERYFYDSEAIAEPAEYGDRGSSFTDERDKITKPNLGTGPRRTSVARGGFNGKTNALEGREAFRAIKDTRNKRTVWTVPTSPYPESHFATFPPDLIKPCILAGTKPGGLVLDPFGGSGTTGQVALELGRRAVLIELNPDYVKLCERRCDVTMGLPL